MQGVLMPWRHNVAPYRCRCPRWCGL